MHQSITIEIKPVPKKRARITRFGNYTPRETEIFERTIKMFCIKNKIIKIDGPIEIGITFYFKRPKKPKYTYPKIGDVDNYAKSVLDALNGVLYDDDSQVIVLTCRKMYDEKDMIKIESFNN